MKKAIEYDPFDFKPRTPEVLGSILNEPQWLELLKNRKKPYEKILPNLIMLSNKVLSDEECDTSIKSISTDYGVKAPLLAKWINLIYDDLFELNSNEPLLFKTDGIRCNINFKQGRKSIYFTLWLKTVPQPLESFCFRFIRGKMLYEIFDIDKIYHEYSQGDHSVSLYLSFPSSNTYRKFILDKALFYKQISDPDLMNLSDSDIDTHLRRLYPR